MSALTFDEIVTIMRNRQAADSALIQKMIQVRHRYNADWVIPYSTSEDMPEQAAGVPALIAETIDNLGMRAASVMPNWQSLPLDPMKDTGIRSIEWANRRRRTVGWVYYQSSMNLALRRAFRHLSGYARSAFIVVPDLEQRHPRIEVRDPLTAYPEPKAPEDLTPIASCGFVYQKSTEWLQRMYPAARVENGGPVGTKVNQMTVTAWDIVEWVDEYCTVIGILGPSEWRDTNRPQRGSNPHVDWNADISLQTCMELHRYPNLTGLCPAQVPRRVTMDAIASQVAHVTGSVDLMSKLQTLAIIAAEKSIFPDRYVVSDANSTPQIVGGVWKDGRTGEINLLKGAKDIGILPSTPDPIAQQTIDRLERNVRVSTGLVPQMGGESYGALRTGKGMDSLMGAAVDPRVQEMQETICPDLQRCNKVALQMFKDYWPKRKYFVFNGTMGDLETTELIPEVHIETVENVVQYPFPGLDIQGVTIQLGQLLGMKAISLDTLRARHPYVADPQAEGRRVETELMEQATLEALAQQAAAGTLPPTYLAMVATERKKSADIFEAIGRADKKLRKQQAKMAPEPGPDEFAAPEQMPGLAQPGSMPVPPGPGGMPMEGPPMGPPPEEMGPMIGPTDDQKGLRRLTEALSQAPPVR